MIRVMFQGRHHIDAHQAVSSGDLFRPDNMLSNGPQIRRWLIPLKPFLRKSNLRRGNHANAALSGHCPRQTTQADAYPHTALDDGPRNFPLTDLQTLHCVVLLLF